MKWQAFYNQYTRLDYSLCQACVPQNTAFGSPAPPQHQVLAMHFHVAGAVAFNAIIGWHRMLAWMKNPALGQTMARLFYMSVSWKRHKEEQLSNPSNIRSFYFIAAQCKMVSAIWESEKKTEQERQERLNILIAEMGSRLAIHPLAQIITTHRGGHPASFLLCSKSPNPRCDTK